jgi:NitT/TauT family transport system permease protein
VSEATTEWRSSDIVLPLGALVVGLLVWWLTTALFAIPPYLFPSPTAVGTQLFGNPTLYAESAVATLRKVAVGGTVGILGGFGLGVLTGTLPLLRTALYPYLVTVRVLPKIAIAPLLLIYLGTGFGTAVVFVALVAFFPLVLNTAAGLSRAPNPHLELLESVDASTVDRLLYVRGPYAIPDIFAGLKQSVTLSVIGAIVAEWVVADTGLGYLILIGSENIRTDIIIAALVTLVVVGFGLYGLVALCQRAVQRRLPVT